jgi:hypothetical protein
MKLTTLDIGAAGEAFRHGYESAMQRIEAASQGAGWGRLLQLRSLLRVLQGRVLTLPRFFYSDQKRIEKFFTYRI